MEVEIFEEPFYILATCWNLLKKSGDFIFKKNSNLEN